MTDDEAFVATILAKPADRIARLVYADWLDERGDPRGQYLRTELDLAATRKRADGRLLRMRLQELRAKIDPVWLAAFDQPRMLLANPTPFSSVWSGTDDRRSYRFIPPLPTEQFRGEYQWLSRQRPPSRPTLQLIAIANRAKELDLTVPPDFMVLMGSRALQKRIRSCTACFFNLPARIVPCPRGEGGHLVRFYSDSQGCEHWYLYLTPQGYSCVVSSGSYLGGSPGPYDPYNSDELAGGFRYCAPSVEAFAYRSWIENEIWYAENVDHDPLTPAEEAYLNYYRKN